MGKAYPHRIFVISFKGWIFLGHNFASVGEEYDGGSAYNGANRFVVEDTHIRASLKIILKGRDSSQPDFFLKSIETIFWEWRWP